MTTKHLTAELLLKAQNRRFASVPLPDLEGELRIGSFTAHTGLVLRQLNAKKERGEAVELEQCVTLVAGSAVDDAGRPIFTEATARQFLERISVETMHTVLDAITKLNGVVAPNPTVASQS